MSEYGLHRNNVYGSAETVQKSLYYDHLENEQMIRNKYELERQKQADKDYLERKKLDADIERKLIETKGYEERQNLDCKARNERELAKTKAELEIQKEKNEIRL